MKALLACVMVSTISLVAGLGAWILTGGTAHAWLLDAGLVLLMATPVLRVFLALVDFTRERDWVFVGTAVAVLVFLALSVALSNRV